MWLRSTSDPEGKGRRLIVENQIRGAFERFTRPCRTLDHGLWNGVLLLCSIEDINMEPTSNSQKDVKFKTYLAPYRESLSYVTWTVRLEISIPNALHAGPKRLSRAVSPVLLSVKELSIYPKTQSLVEIGIFMERSDIPGHFEVSREWCLLLVFSWVNGC